jgi:hypothetical protein
VRQVLVKRAGSAPGHEGKTSAMIARNLIRSVSTERWSEDMVSVGRYLHRRMA